LLSLIAVTKYSGLIRRGKILSRGIGMSTFGLVEYKDASPEVRAVYDDIMATRKTDWINNFWKAIAHDPSTLKRTWESIKQIMGPGALDALTKEMIYVAVSVANNCHYCIASHTASAVKKGMTPEMFKELQAVIGMAAETNKLVTGYRVEIDQQFERPFGAGS
jgi:AhpD family alkylhydroperoxidase